MAEHNCETCAWRRKAEANPRGFMARLWRWHTTWCPGWKKYQQSLQDGRDTSTGHDDDGEAARS